MSVVLKYLEYLEVSPLETYWVYDICPEMPYWDEEKKDYVCSKKIKRVEAREARAVIKEEGLKCVCNNEHGRIYA